MLGTEDGTFCLLRCSAIEPMTCPTEERAWCRCDGNRPLGCMLCRSASGISNVALEPRTTQPQPDGMPNGETVFQGQKYKHAAGILPLTLPLQQTPLCPLCSRSPQLLISGATCRYFQPHHLTSGRSSRTALPSPSSSVSEIPSGVNV